MERCAEAICTAFAAGSRPGRLQVLIRRYRAAEREHVMADQAFRAAAAAEIARKKALVEEAQRARTPEAKMLDNRETKRAMTAEEKRLAQLARANVTATPGTATAGRDYELAHTGKGWFARSLKPRDLLQRRHTHARETVLRALDNLMEQERVEASMPSPKFEPGVDGGSMGGGLPRQVVASFDMQAVRERVGGRGMRILEMRILGGFRPAHIGRALGMSEYRAQERFVEALDEAGRALGLLPETEGLTEMGLRRRA
jgi:hypothetical protein